MNRLIGGLVVVVSLAICLGFYMGWFQLGSENVDGKSNVTLSVDKVKVKEDSKAAVEKVEGLGNQIKEKVNGTTDITMDGTLVSIINDKLTMANKEGKEHGHSLVANTKVTRDGRVSGVAELKKGDKIRVTTEKNVAVRIEALDKDAEFANESSNVKSSGPTGSR